ncbi:phage tail terminator protein [Avibacterium endocarditidis]|uniref:phage tail terminator protein n=1 Tax=Avibacterium endocarditidis TaxID=380674 RepID=UPI0011B4FA0A|nr:phage tail terminator protein [Avibacterium endocarditidis]
MNIHSEIRKQVLANLQGKIEGIERFINGRPVFADVEKELPAIAVFIDEVRC